MAKTQFSIPSLAEADAEYSALAEKYHQLSQDAAEASRQVLELEDDIRTRKAPGIRPGIAELLGDVVDHSLTDRPRRLVELRQRAADLEAATEIIRRRRDDRRGIVSVAAAKIVKPEYGQRVAAFIAALNAAKAAYDAMEEIVDGLEREDVHVTYLAPARTSFFAGHENGVTRFVAAARSNAHVQ
jgi:hypothetical protein